MYNTDSPDEFSFYEDLNEEYEKVEKKDVNDIVDDKDNIFRKREKVSKSRYPKFFMQIKLIYELLRDYRKKNYTDIPWRTIGFLVLLIVYFINPLDLVPDIIPFFGYADDAAVFAAVLASFSKDLKNYCDWKGYDFNKYL
jgi:uncharacterized membrane protein YkvA (DUF1232 family)